MSRSLNDIYTKIAAIMEFAELTKSAAGPIGKALIGKPAMALSLWAKDQPELKEKIVEIWDSVVADVGDRANYGGCWAFFINRWNKRFREGKVPVACKYEYTRKSAKDIALPANNETVEDYNAETAKTDKILKTTTKSTASARKRVATEIEKKVKSLNDEMTAAIEKAKNKKIKINDIPSESTKMDAQKEIIAIQKQVIEIKSKIKTTENVMNDVEKTIYIMQYVPVTSVDFEREFQSSLKKISDSNDVLNNEIDKIQREFDNITKEFNKMVQKVASKKEAIIDPISIGLGLGVVTLISAMFTKWFWSKIRNFFKFILGAIDSWWKFNEKELESLLYLKDLAKIALNEIALEKNIEISKSLEKDIFSQKERIRLDLPKIEELNPLAQI
jgi:hypothetical protein